jgi:hypothetical protein
VSYHSIHLFGLLTPCNVVLRHIIAKIGARPARLTDSPLSSRRPISNNTMIFAQE